MIRMRDTFIYNDNSFKVIAISDGCVLGVAENGNSSVTLPIDSFSDKMATYNSHDEYMRRYGNVKPPPGKIH